MSAQALRPVQADSKPSDETPTPGERIYQMVRERVDLADGASPNAVVDESLLDALSRDELREAARQGLIDIAQSVARQLRRSRRNGKVPSSNGSAKWDSVAEVANDPEHRDIFMQKICVANSKSGEGIWRELGDCKKQEMQSAANRLRPQARTLVDRIARYEELAKKLTGDRTVRDLGEKRVREILYA